MNRSRALLAVFAAALMGAGVFVLVPTASADPEPDLHCEGHNVAPNVKDESGVDDNDFVPAEGTLICVKASTGNTGIIVADGETTLQEYLFEAGIIDGSGEQGKDVSYWVTYPPGTTTSSTSSSTTSSSTTSSSTTSSSTTSTSTTSTTAPTTSTTIVGPSLFSFGAAGTECQAGVPFIVITFANTFPELAGDVGTLQVFALADDSFLGEVEVIYAPGETVEILYPGSAVDSEGNVTDVPGWNLVDGFWVIDESDAYLRDGLLLEYNLGEETASAEVTYPPETSLCANPENPPVTTSTSTTVPGETTTTLTSINPPSGSPGLPRTGSDSGLPVAVGLALIGAGLVTLDLRRRVT